MSKLKLKNIQQTVISSVTQPLKLGGIAEDASDAKIVIESNGNMTLNQVVGIKFPATQVPSADPNTLDDYEEGTWKPSVGGTATYLLQTGKYVKIGKLVTISMQIAITIIGTGNTGVISGLPFSGSMGGASIFYFATLNGSFSSITAQVTGSTLSLRGVTTPSNNMSVITPLTSGSSIELSCTYIVD